MSVWTTPTTRSTGLLVTAAIWNADIANNLIYLKTAPVFDTAVIIGAATTAGVRLDLESGTLAVREGDDSAYAPLITSVVNLPSGGSINFASGDVTITHATNQLTFAGADHATAPYTFSGTTNGYLFNVNNVNTGKAAIAFKTNGATIGVIGLSGSYTGDGSTNMAVFAETGYDFRVATNGSTTTKFMVDTTGNVGIGVTPTSLLHLRASAPTLTLDDSGNTTAAISYRPQAASYAERGRLSWDLVNAEMRLAAGASGGSFFQTFYTNGTERMRIPGAGGVQCVTTLSVGNATPAASGAGVTFPAAQSSSSDANTLDDYQEASWTPTIVGSTTAGTGTYASGRFGRYTKIGNMITLWANLNWIGHTGTGNIEIGGLPENVVSLTDYRSAGVAITNDIALTAGNLAAVRAADAGTTLQLIQQPTGGGLWSNVPMDTNGGLTLTITYMTN